MEAGPSREPPSGPPASALAEEDGYAMELTAWRGRLVQWEAAFGVCAGDSILGHPPTSRWRTHDEVLRSQRDAAIEQRWR